MGSWPSHGTKLHFLSWDSSPWQPLPPNCAWRQVRWRRCIPPPQLALHSDHSPQSLHSASTAAMKNVQHHQKTIATVLSTIYGLHTPSLYKDAKIQVPVNLLFLLYIFKPFGVCVCARARARARVCVCVLLYVFACSLFFFWVLWVLFADRVRVERGWSTLVYAKNIDGRDKRKKARLSKLFYV